MVFFKVISELKWLTDICSLAMYMLSLRAGLLVLKGASGDWFIHMPMGAQRQGLTSHSSFAECVAVKLINFIADLQSSIL